MELAQASSVQHSKSSHRVSTSLFFFQWQHPCCLNVHFLISNNRQIKLSGKWSDFPIFQTNCENKVNNECEGNKFSSRLAQIAQGRVSVPPLFPWLSEEHGTCYPEGYTVGKLELDLSEYKIEMLLLTQGGRGAAGLSVIVFTLIIKLMKAIASDKMCPSRLYLIHLSYI